jgi:hypothetical protein
MSKTTRTNGRRAEHRGTLSHLVPLCRPACPVWSALRGPRLADAVGAQSSGEAA